MNSIPVKKLNNGVEMPMLGFGSAALDRGDTLHKTISCAVENGYRFFDAAPFYQNEDDIGVALRETGISRDQLFICTKLENAYHKYNDAINAFKGSLKNMGLDYLDLYLIHFPMPSLNLYCEAWRALETLYKEGLVRAIGLSNFYQHHMDKILDVCEIKPAVVELECNPYMTIEPLRAYCAEKDIAVINWFPLGGPKDPLVPYPEENYKILVEDETLTKIGEKYQKTAAQVALRWSIDSGMTPIPKSQNPKRIAQNAQIFDFKLTPDEIATIDALNYDRRFGPDSDTFDDITV